MVESLPYWISVGKKLKGFLGSHCYFHWNDNFASISSVESDSFFYDGLADVYDADDE